MLLANRTAIVTGSGRGIGRAMAQRFASEGAAVVLAARTERELKSVAQEIELAGGRVAFVAADISHDLDCAKIVEVVQDHFGGIDILVNNAAIYGPIKPIEEITSEEWDEVMVVNLRGAAQLTRCVLPQMYARRSGTVLNVSSVAAKAATALNGPYAASKAALLSFTRTLAAEAAPKGIRVNAISPGPVPETEMSQALTRGLAEYYHGEPREMLARITGRILQGRPQTADEIAAAALFLVSDAASAITGQTLNVDGGMIFY